MKRALTVLIVSICGVGGALVSVNALQNRDDQYSRREADIIGARLFKAILGRDGGPVAPGEASAQIVLGHLDAQVGAMFNSPEFRQKSSGMSPAQLLDQIYQGLLDRRADEGGVRTYLREIEQRHYASVVTKIIGDPEFQARILGRSGQPNRSGDSDSRGGPDRRGDFNRRGDSDRRGDFNRRGGPGRPRFNAEDLMRAAEACQAQVVEQVRGDVRRPVLLRFQGMDRSSAGWGAETIRGSAIDALDRDRPLSYRCEMDRNRFVPSRVTYTFDDGRGDRDYPPARGRMDRDYPLASVRSCQDGVRARLERQGGRRDVVFESAGVSEWDGGLERVYGSGRERGGSNFTFTYQCDVDRGRVTRADFQPAR